MRISGLTAVGALTSGSINWSGNIVTTGSGTFSASGVSGFFTGSDPDQGISIKSTATAGREYLLKSAGSASGNIPGAGFYIYDFTGLRVALSIADSGAVSTNGGSLTAGAISGTTGTFTGTTRIDSASTAEFIANGATGFSGRYTFYLNGSRVAAWLSNASGSITMIDGSGNTLHVLSATGINVAGTLSSSGQVLGGGATEQASSDLSGRFSGAISIGSNIYNNMYYDAIQTRFEYSANGYATMLATNGNSIGQFEFYCLSNNVSGAGALLTLGSPVAIISSTGLSVTGTLGATGRIGNDGLPTDPSTGTLDGFTVGDSVDGQFVVSANANGSHWRRRTSDGAIISFWRDTTQVGSISVTTTATAYNTSSALDKKCNFRAITSLQSGTFFDGAKPWLHDWKTGEKDSIGWGAEEIHANMIAAGLPAWGVILAPDGGSVVDYSKVPDPITAAEIKSLRARIALLEAALNK